MDEPFLPFDDPEFDHLLDEVMQDTGLVTALTDQASHNERLLDYSRAVAAPHPDLVAQHGDEVALRLTILFAFIHGYLVRDRLD
jgi:hypothetical protein